MLMFLFVCLTVIIVLKSTHLYAVEESVQPNKLVSGPCSVLSLFFMPTLLQ